MRSMAVSVIDAGGKHVFERVVACEIEVIMKSPTKATHQKSSSLHSSSSASGDGR